MKTTQEYPIIKNRKINVALIGCGRISFKHVISIFHHSKDLNLVALCDTNIQNIKEIKNLINKEAKDKKSAEKVQIYEKYDEIGAKRLLEVAYGWCKPQAACER